MKAVSFTVEGFLGEKAALEVAAVSTARPSSDSIPYRSDSCLSMSFAS